MITQNFIYVGVLAQIIGASSYLVDTVKGKIKPNRVSWFMWMLAPMIAFAAEMKQGVGITSLVTFIVGFMPLLVFIGTFVNKKAEWKLNKLDLLCGIFSIGGLFLWLVTKVGNIAIFFSILSDGLAALPTVIKSFHHPESESDMAFWGQAINGGMALLVINKWNIQTFGFPLYLFILGIILILLIRLRLGIAVKKYLIKFKS